jgi:hypothetical protein
MASGQVLAVQPPGSEINRVSGAAPYQEENDENWNRDANQPEKAPADYAAFTLGFSKCFHTFMLV